MKLNTQALVALIGAMAAAFAFLAVMAYLKHANVTSSAQDLQGWVDAARLRARDSSAGGTTLIVYQGTKNVQVATYDGVPQDLGNMSAAPIDGPHDLPANVTLSAPGVSTTLPFAIVFESDGSAALVQWGIGSGALAGPPACAVAGTQTIVVAQGNEKATTTLTCLSGLLQS